MIVTVFRTRLIPGVDDKYGPMGERMSELARGVPGYVSHKGYVAADGERVTIVEFESEEALNRWRVDPEHRGAKKSADSKLSTANSDTRSAASCARGHGQPRPTRWINPTLKWLLPRPLDAFGIPRTASCGLDGVRS